MEGLPAVVCVKAAWVGDDGKNLSRRHRGTVKRKLVKRKLVKSKAVKSRSGARKKISAKTKTSGRARAAR
jgi:hypothetical protein